MPTNQLNLEGKVRAAAKTLINAGVERATAVRDLASRYPSVSLAEVNRQYDYVVDSIEIVDRLMAHPKRLFANPSVVAGCADRSNRVRVRVTINFIDGGTGERVRFSHQTDLRGGGQWGNVLYHAINDTVLMARMRNYKPPEMGYEHITGMPFYTIDYAECY